MTDYVLIGTFLEERDLINRLGEAYVEYRRRTPAFIPRLRLPPAGQKRAGEVGRDSAPGG